MSINSLSDWSAVELAAQTHELGHVETPKVPAPTAQQQLMFLTNRCASLESRLRDIQRHIVAAQMWLSLGQTDRATEEVNKCVLL